MALLKTAATYFPLKQYQVFLLKTPALALIHFEPVGRLF